MILKLELFAIPFLADISNIIYCAGYNIRTKKHNQGKCHKFVASVDCAFYLEINLKKLQSGFGENVN